MFNQQINPLDWSRFYCSLWSVRLHRHIENKSPTSTKSTNNNFPTKLEQEFEANIAWKARIENIKRRDSYYNPIMLHVHSQHPTDKFGCSLNFIGLLRVFITPLVTTLLRGEND